MKPQTFVVVAAGALLALACSPSEKAGDGTPDSSTNSASSTVTTAPRTPPSSGPARSTSPTVPAGTWTQFEAFFGGDLVDPCGLDHGAFTPAVTPPYLGSENGFYAIASSYVVGDELVWCVYGFETDVPIEVSVRGPEDTEDRFHVTLDRASPSDCRSVDDECRGDELRHLLAPTGSSPQVLSAKGFDTHGPPSAALGGWILPGTPAGFYAIVARQGSIRTSHHVEVRHRDEPGIDVGTWIDEGGRKRRAAVLVGFEPNTEVPLALYRLTGAAPPAPWAFVSDLGSAAVDEHGETSWTFDTPASLVPGRYCVLAVETIPRKGAADPCHFLARFDGSINVP